MENIDTFSIYDGGWYWLALAYNKNEQYQEAITAYRKVLELEPNHENIKEALKDLQKKLNKK